MAACNQKANECTICFRNYKHKFILTQHLTRVHNQQTKSPCDVCGKYFLSKGNLKTHQASVHEKLMQKCDICGKDFSSELYLSKHKKSHLQEGEQISCELCDNIFASVRAFNTL